MGKKRESLVKVNSNNHLKWEVLLYYITTLIPQQSWLVVCL